MEKIKTISSSNQEEFENKVNDLLADGYVISSTSSGFVNSESYGFCDNWQAILVKRSEEVEE